MPDRIEALRGMLLQDPNNSRVRHMLANELGNGGKIEEALSEYTSLTAADPDYVPGYFQAGRLAEEHGRIELAREWYERGLANARRTGDRHAENEIQAALELLS